MTLGEQELVASSTIGIWVPRSVGEATVDQSDNESVHSNQVQAATVRRRPLKGANHAIGACFSSKYPSGEASATTSQRLAGADAASFTTSLIAI